MTPRADIDWKNPQDQTRGEVIRLEAIVNNPERAWPGAICQIPDQLALFVQ